MFRLQIGSRVLDVSQELTELEKEQQLEEGFIRKLIEGDDWEFAIKSTALVEAALEGLLGARLAIKGHSTANTQGALREFVGRLTLQGQNSKVGLALGLDLISDTDKRHIGHVAHIRNRYVHSISNVRKGLLEVVGRPYMEAALVAVLGREGLAKMSLDDRQLAGAFKISLWLWLLTFLAGTRFRREPSSLLDLLNMSESKPPEM